MRSEQLRRAAGIALCVLLLLSMPLINGFPFTYPDTGTYLRSAFRIYVPYDRPIWYGLFLRISSLGGTSLWGPVVAQASLSVFVLLRTLRHFGVAGAGRQVLVVALLSWFTGISWYAGQLMPDIFTGIGALALMLLLIDKASLPLRISYGLLVVLAVLVHTSNLLTFTLVLLLAMVAFRAVPWARRRNVGVLVLACWPLLGALNVLVVGKAELGRGGHVFLTARLIDAGIMNDWLDEHCPDGSGLCQYRGTMPATTNEFLWSPSSPLYAMGGWEATAKDYQGVVRSALTTPRLLVRFVGNSVNGAARQVVEWRVGAGFASPDLQDPNNPVHDMLLNTMEQDFPAFISSRQVTGDGTEGWLVLRDKVFFLVMLLSHLALLGLLLWRPAFLPPQWQSAALLVVAALLANALVCASLSMVADRFGSRLNWTVPLLVLIAILPAVKAFWAKRQRGAVPDIVGR